MNQEIWEPVTGRAAGYPYEVSNKGRVRRAEGGQGTRKGLILSIYVGTRYPYLNLCHKGRSKTFKVHSLVADAFLGPPPGVIGNGRNEWQVDHKDDDKTNSCVENLEWVTGKENKERAIESGLSCILLDQSGENNRQAKLTRKEVMEIRKLYKTGDYTHRELGNKFRVSRRHIGNIINGKRWAHV